MIIVCHRGKCLVCCFDLDYSERRSGFSREHPSDRDEFAAKAAPTKLKTSVFSVASVANI